MQWCAVFWNIFANKEYDNSCQSHKFIVIHANCGLQYFSLQWICWIYQLPLKHLTRMACEHKMINWLMSRTWWQCCSQCMNLWQKSIQVLLVYHSVLICCSIGCLMCMIGKFCLPMIVSFVYNWIGWWFNKKFYYLNCILTFAANELGRLEFFHLRLAWFCSVRAILRKNTDVSRDLKWCSSCSISFLLSSNFI